MKAVPLALVMLVGCSEPDGEPIEHPPDMHLVTITKSGAGEGSVTGDGIDCGADCTESIAADTVLTLTASALGAAQFRTWTAGNCATLTTCEITVTGDLTIDARFAEPTKIGQVDALGETSSAAEDTLFGAAIEVTKPYTLLSFGIHIVEGGSNGQLALYADVGGAPGALVAETAPTLLVTGDNEIPAIAPIALAVGTYWIMNLYETRTFIPVSTSDPTRVIRFTRHPFGTPLPTTFPAGTNGMGERYSHYLSVE